MAGGVVHRWTVEAAGFQVNLDTLIMTWGVMLLLLGLAFTAVKSLQRKPTNSQSVVEATVEFVENIIKAQIGPHVVPYMGLIGSIFLFVLFANFQGIIPWKSLAAFGFPKMLAPTNDLNTTAALATIALVSYFYFGISKKGVVGYFSHYFQPVFMFPLHVIEDIVRPLSLAMRLFGNIIGGQILITVLLMLAPVLIPTPIIAFEFFVAFIQAYIFALLTASYIGAATQGHDDHEHAKAAAH